MFSIYRLDRMLDKAGALLTDNRVDEAMEVIQKAEKMRPDDQYLQLIKGMALFRKGDYTQARELLTLSDEKLRADALPAVYLGRICIEEQDFEKAIEHFKRAESKDRLHPDVHYYAGIAYLKMNMLEEATREFELVLSEKKEFVLARILTLLEWNNLHAKS